MSRRTLPLRLYFFASFAALGVYSPFFPRWLVARGIEGAAMGAVVATIPAMALVGPPIVGVLADWLGLRGSLLRVACLGSFLAFAALALAGLVDHHLTFFEIFAIMLAFAAFRAPMLMIADVVAMEGESDAGNAYGHTRVWGSVGFLVAAIGVGRFLDPEGAKAFPAAVSVLLFGAMLAAFALPHEPRVVRPMLMRDLHSLITSKDFPLLLAIAFGAEFAISSYDLCFSLYLSDCGASNALIGFAWGFGVTIEILLMIVAAPLLERVRPPVAIVFALAGVVLRCALLANVRAVRALVLVQLLHTPSVCLLWIAALAHVKERVPPRVFARAQGLFSAAVAAGSAVGMLVWGAMYRGAGGRTTFGVAAFVAAGIVMLALRWLRLVSRAPMANGIDM